MPCGGPSLPTPSEIDAITDRVLAVLKEEFFIFQCEPGYFIESRTKAVDSLKEAIKEVLWQDACEGF
jgi:hypothetical protein